MSTNSRGPVTELVATINRIKKLLNVVGKLEKNSKKKSEKTSEILRKL